MWQPDINAVLKFLTYLFSLNLSYSALNTARSTLSTVLGRFEGCPLGEHKLVVDFMKGVSKLRPPAPRYHVTWDPDSVLTRLALWKTADCNLKSLSLKLVALLALCTGQRVQTLASIDLCNIIWNEPVQIKLTGILKTTSVSKSNPILVLPPYHDKELCPVYTLRKYVEVTEPIRIEEKKLLISFVKPHKSVGSQSISRWLVEVLAIADIDTKMFHAHSYRHSSTSKAAMSGVNIDTIFSRAGWSKNSNTFAKFYNRPIVNVNDFAEKVLTVRSSK